MRSRRYSKKLSEAGRKAARARWDRENARIEAEMPDRLREMERRRVLNEGFANEGDYIGTLEWRDKTGKVRKWVIRRGPRYNQMLIDGVEAPKSVTVLMSKLRKSLSVYFRSS